MISLAETSSLPTTLGTKEVAELLGVGLTRLKQSVREGSLPPELMPLRLGRAWRWPTARILAAVGLGSEIERAPACDEGASYGKQVHGDVTPIRRQRPDAS